MSFKIKSIVLSFTLSTVLCLMSELRAEEPISYSAVPKLKWSSTSDKFVLLNLNGDCEIFDSSGNSLWKPSGKVDTAEFSPDGEKIAFSSANGLSVYVFKTSRSVVLSALNTGDLIADLQWSPNGQTVSYWKRSLVSDTQASAELCLVRTSDGNKKSLVSMSQPQLNGFPLEPEKQAPLIRAQEEAERAARAKPSSISQ